MGQNSSQVGLSWFAGAAVLALALAACSAPAPSGLPPGQATSSQTRPSSSTPMTPGTSAATAGATPDTTAGAAPGTPGGGTGGFGTIAEACKAVSATVLSALVLPVAAAPGKNTADVGKAKESLAKMQGQAPAELKESFDKLKSIADDAGQDPSRFNSTEFDQAIVPIDAWLQANC